MGWKILELILLGCGWLFLFSLTRFFKGFGLWFCKGTWWCSQPTHEQKKKTWFFVRLEPLENNDQILFGRNRRLFGCQVLPCVCFSPPQPVDVITPPPLVLFFAALEMGICQTKMFWEAVESRIPRYDKNRKYTKDMSKGWTLLYYWYLQPLFSQLDFTHLPKALVLRQLISRRFGSSRQIVRKLAVPKLGPISRWEKTNASRGSWFLKVCFWGDEWSHAVILANRHWYFIYGSLLATLKRSLNPLSLGGSKDLFRV